MTTESLGAKGPESKEFKNSQDRIRAERRKSGERTMITDRDFYAYELRLAFDPEELRGKLVLDIGSGKNEIFSKEAEKKGIKVISLNPKKRNTERAYRTKENEGEPLLSVMADAQELPFPDNTFDFELALFSVPLYLEGNLHEEEDCKHFLEEVVRTLKPGGKAYIYPIFVGVYGQRKFMKQALKSLEGRIKYDFSGDDDERLIITKN